MGFYSDLIRICSDLIRIYSDLIRIYSDLMGYELDINRMYPWDLGKLTEHSELERSTIFHGKTHSFLWPWFNIL